MRELAEETGLDPAQLTIEPGWTMVMEAGRIALMRRLVSKLDADALVDRITRFLDSEAEPELARMHVVRRADDIPAARMPSFQRAYLRWALAERGPDEAAGR